MYGAGCDVIAVFTLFPGTGSEVTPDMGIGTGSEVTPDMGIGTGAKVALDEAATTGLGAKVELELEISAGKTIDDDFSKDCIAPPAGVVCELDRSLLIEANASGGIVITGIGGSVGYPGCGALVGPGGNVGLTYGFFDIGIASDL